MIVQNGRDRFLEDAPKLAQMILTDGGAGDLIAGLPAVQWNVKNCPDVAWRLFCPDYLAEFARHQIPGIAVFPFSEAKPHFRNDLLTLTTQWHNQHTPMRTHPTDYAFHMLCDRKPPHLIYRDYIQVIPSQIDTEKFDLPRSYVCIGATSREKCKAMSPDLIAGITRYLKARGITPVYLGQTNTKTGTAVEMQSQAASADYSEGINLIDQTTLLEASAIIARSMAFVGMDGGLMHLAGCTQAPIVAGFTLVEPAQVAPYRWGGQKFKFQAVEPYSEIPNRYYQSKTTVTTKGDHRLFPGWEAVLADLTVEKFVTAIKEVLKDS